jgi:TRAP-type C4-dicarboxylate transport system permease small subunit
MLRKFLDGLYLCSGIMSAAFLALICISILTQVVARLLGLTTDTTEISGFFMAASTFLGLAYTFRHGAHIRVGLLVVRFKGVRRKAFELWCCGFGTLLIGYLAWQATLFTMQSWEFDDISPGIMAIPFWIPQSGMSLGLVILTIALVDAFLCIANDKVAGYEVNDDTALSE